MLCDKYSDLRVNARFRFLIEPLYSLHFTNRLGLISNFCSNYSQWVTADCCCVCFLKTREALGWVKTTSFCCDNLLEIPASLANLGHAPHWWLWVIVVLIRQDIGISSIGLVGERRLHFRKASVLRLFYLTRHADVGGVWHISDMYAYFPRRLQLVSISFTPLETLLQLTVVFSSLHPVLVAVFRSTVC